MRRRFFATGMVLAMLVVGLVPAAFASIDGRGAERPGPAETLAEEPLDDTGVSDADDSRTRDILHADDVIVNGSLCVGFDCPNGYGFGFDTVVLRENNLRILFEDTSTAGSFPTNDWRILINQSTNGGQSYFGIEDTSAARTLFRLAAGAPENSLTVDSQGDVGIGLSTAATELHIRDGDTPTTRLEQDGSSGFTAQTWDVAGNEANFFIRDATNGSTLPFRIRPGAPTSSIDIQADGEIGFGTASPRDSVHLLRTDGTAGITVEENNATVKTRYLLRLENIGGSMMTFDNDSEEWRVGSNNTGAFLINLDDGAGDIELRLLSSGNLQIAGSLSEGSDRDSKHRIEALDAAANLDAVLELPIFEWSYIGEAARHIGPMAQDFAAVFGLGSDDTTISARDMAGVSLAAIQALEAENRDLEDRIESLEERLADLEALVADLAG